MESELVRAARVKKDSVEERDSLKRCAEMSEKLARGLQDEVDNYRDEVLNNSTLHEITNYAAKYMCTASFPVLLNCFSRAITSFTVAFGPPHSA